MKLDRLSVILPTILLLLHSAPVAVAQSPDTLWTRTFGGSNIDVGHAVALVPDGGFVIAGYTRSYGTMSGRNVLLIRTTPAGDTLWIRAYGGNADDEGTAVAPTADGGFIVAGYTKSFGAGLKDFYLIKTDSAGNTVWSGVFGGSSDDEAYGVVQTTDGGYVAAGATSSFGAGSRDAWLIRVGPTGSERWRRTLGGLSSDGARSIRQTADGGFIFTGWTFSYGPQAVGNAWLVRTDTAGFQIWQKPFGGSDVDRGNAVCQTPDGGYALAGYTASTGAGLDDMLLIRTDSAGNETWSRTFGGTGRDYGNAIQPTSDGGFVIAGYTLSFGAGGDDVWLVKTDAQGSEQWSRTFGGSASDVAYGVGQTSDGGYILTGHTLSYGAGVHDVWLIRIEGEAWCTEPAVRHPLMFRDEGPGRDTLWWAVGQGATCGLDSALCEGGWEEPPPPPAGVFDVRFNGGTCTTGTHRAYLPEASGHVDTINIRLQTGDVGLPVTIRWDSVDTPVGQLDSVVLTDLFGGIIFRTSVRGSGEAQITSPLVTDLHLLFFHAPLGVDDPATEPREFRLFQNYPNPFNPVTTITFAVPRGGPDGTWQTVSLRVFDLLGREIATLISGSRAPGEFSVAFDASSLAGGVYLYRLTADSYTAVRKMVLLK